MLAAVSLFADGGLSDQRLQSPPKRFVKLSHKPKATRNTNKIGGGILLSFLAHCLRTAFVDGVLDEIEIESNIEGFKPIGAPRHRITLSIPARLNRGITARV